MDKHKMITIAMVVLIVLLVIALLLAIAIFVQIRDQIRDLAARVLALEQANRKSLNHLTADELMSASVALNLFRSQLDLLDNANEHLKKALNPEKNRKK